MLFYRLAANNEQFLTKVLGIKDPKHRSKITIKAMDVVLFGPPKGQNCQIYILLHCIEFDIVIVLHFIYSVNFKHFAGHSVRYIIKA